MITEYLGWGEHGVATNRPVVNEYAARSNGVRVVLGRLRLELGDKNVKNWAADPSPFGCRGEKIVVGMDAAQTYAVDGCGGKGRRLERG